MMNRSYLTNLVFDTLKVVILAGAGLLTLVLITRLIGGPSVSVNQITTEKTSTFDVNGESELSVVPDEARVSVGVTVNQPTVQRAQQELNSKLDQIRKGLTELGLQEDEIKTTNYSIYPEYTYSPEQPQRINGYRADTTLELRLTDFEKLNQAIDAATTAGANTVGNIQFTLSEEKQHEVEQDARQEAIDQAKNKAKDLASLAGLRLGKVINVVELNNNAPIGPVFAEGFAGKSAAGGGGDATQVEPGKTTYHYEVMLSFETL